MGFSKRMMAQERAAALRAEAEAKRRALGPEIAEAEELIRRRTRRVARGGGAPWYPTIGTALLAGISILNFVCPACQICGATRLADDRQAPTGNNRGFDSTAIVHPVHAQPAICPPAGIETKRRLNARPGEKPMGGCRRTGEGWPGL